MKTPIKWLICCGVCALTKTAFAQAEYGSPYTPSLSTNAPAVKQDSRQFLHAKNLIGLEAKDNQGQKLGKVRDIVFNPQNGETFAAIGVERGSFALVPSRSLSVSSGTGLLGKDEVTLNATKQALDGAPVIANDDWRSLDNPKFIQIIYSHYNLQGPSAVGGVAPGSLGGKSGGAGASSPNKEAKPH